MTADATAALQRRSPLGNTANAVVASGGGVTVTERPFLAQVLLRMAPDAAGLAAARSALGLDLPTTPRLVRATDAPRLAIWLGPDEWLVVDATDASALEARIAGATRSHGGTAVSVSAHRTLLELTGPRVRDLLAAGCSIDVHPRVFDVGAAAQTQLARVDVILGRGDTDMYHVAVRASFARYLVDWLSDAITGLEGDDA